MTVRSCRRPRSGLARWRLCLGLIGISAVVFVACVPFVRVPMQPSPAFVAIYNAVSILNDFITSVILFGQFNILRSRALLLLASGYLFTSLISVVQLLTFPDLFAVGGLLGAGSQTALWLCIFWHGGFPLVVSFLCAVSRQWPRGRVTPRIAIVSASAAVIGAVFALVAATWGAENARLCRAAGCNRLYGLATSRQSDRHHVGSGSVRVAVGEPSAQAAEPVAHGRDGLLALRYNPEFVFERRSL